MTSTSRARDGGSGSGRPPSRGSGSSAVGGAGGGGAGGGDAGGSGSGGQATTRSSSTAYAEASASGPKTLEEMRESYARSVTVDLRGHRKKVHCLKWSPNGRYLATGSVDETVRIWSLESHREARQAMGWLIGEPHGLGVAGGA